MELKIVEMASGNGHLGGVCGEIIEARADDPAQVRLQGVRIARRRQQARFPRDDRLADTSHIRSDHRHRRPHCLQNAVRESLGARREHKHLRACDQFSHVAAKAEQPDTVVQPKPLDKFSNSGFERSIAYQIEAPGKRLESCQSVQKGRMVFRLFHARDHYQSRRVSARVTAQRRRDVRHAVVNHRQFSSSRNAATQR